MSSFSKGDVLGGRYVVQELIGRSFTSKIYKVVDSLAMETLAVKAFEPNVLSGEEGLEKLDAALVPARIMQHHNIIRIRGCELDGDTVLAVMEHGEGRALRDITAGHTRVAPPLVAQVFSQVCLAMGYLHARGIISRRLGPDKIIVRAEDNAVKILIGYQRFLPPATDMPCVDISEFAFIVNPVYFPPELRSGRCSDAQRAEVYSIGCMMFECLNGTPPFKGKSGPETVTMHAAEPVPNLIEVVPDELRLIVEKCLCKDPGRRFVNLDALRQALIKFG